MNIPFDVSSGQEIYLRWVILALGLNSAAFALATAISCRSFMKLVNLLFRKNPLKIKAYRSFYRYHTRYWLVLGISILAHVMIAVSHTGIPLIGSTDPDANIHRVILLFGLISAASVLVVLFSCRIFPLLMSPVLSRNLLKGEKYQWIYGYHSYVWLAFGIFIAVHITLGFIHGL